jgi:hypothetical protein
MNTPEPHIAANAVRNLRIYRAVGRVDGKITYRIQLAAESHGEAWLICKTHRPEVDWNITRTKSTGQPLLGWCNHG